MSSLHFSPSGEKQALNRHRPKYSQMLCLVVFWHLDPFDMIDVKSRPTKPFGPVSGLKRQFDKWYLFHSAPTPHPPARRVFSPGVLRSKDFFDPIFVVFRDFCKSYFWHPYFYRVFGYFRWFRWFLVILVFLVIFNNFGDFGDFFSPRKRERERGEK